MEAPATGIIPINTSELKKISNEELVTHFEALASCSGRSEIRGQAFVKNTLRQEILLRMKKK